jgi:hypothetical protein
MCLDDLPLIMLEMQDERKPQRYDARLRVELRANCCPSDASFDLGVHVANLSPRVATRLPHLFHHHESGFLAITPIFFRIRSETLKSGLS